MLCYQPLPQNSSYLHKCVVHVHGYTSSVGSRNGDYPA